MKKASRRTARDQTQVRITILSTLIGTFFGLALLKFGTPIILDKMVEAPTNWIEALFFSWPAIAGYALTGGLIIATLPLADWKPFRPKWLFWLPLVWLAWQFIAATKSVDRELTRATLGHFTICVLWFYIGCLALRRDRHLVLFGTALTIGFTLIIWSGLQQHFGGLEATRRMVYEQPNWQELPPEYLQKVASTRIFATMFYPNSFAGAILIFLPLTLYFLWDRTRFLQVPSRIVISATFGAAALACLYWSGSKAGWLIALLLFATVLLHLGVPRRLKIIGAILLIVLGGLGFFWKYSDYFAKGATSVAARFDYWDAALKTAMNNPLLGTGPGTFMRPYSELKPPEAEMARLTHNDYLEQASDAGFPSMLFYSVLVGFSVISLHRRSVGHPVSFFVWIGLLAFALQSTVEFGLYIPAIAWPVFALLGWLWGQPESTERSSGDSK